MGLSAVLDTELAWFSEIEPAAVTVMQHHHPGLPNLGDITTVDWAQVEPVEILTGGFPCFPAGTLIDAGEDGLRAIETLRVGDSVLTHRRRRRTVTSVMRRQADDVLTIKAMGAPAFQATAEHPFYVRRMSIGPNQKRTWAKPEWVETGQLDKSCWLAMPLDEAGTSRIVGEQLAYITGRWLGDGWIVDHKRTSNVPQGHRGSRINSRVHKVIICADYPEADELAVAIKAAGLHATRAPDRTAVKFHISSQALLKLLRPFGRGAAGKRLPGWVFTAPSGERSALLRGWLDSDGSKDQSGALRGASISQELAYGMARLARNVYGRAISVHRAKREPTALIEGRLVTQQDSFEVVIPPGNREAFVEGGYAWVPIRSVSEAQPCEVFNLSVDEDESYIAWGYAVHNCTDVSSAGKRAGLRPGTRSGLWSQMAYAVAQLRPQLVVIENVRGLLSADAHCDLEPCPWCLGDNEGRPLRALGAVLGDLASIGYDARWCGLRAADIGAPHGRFRVFICASPSNPHSGDREGGPTARLQRQTGSTTGSPTDPDGIGPIRCGRSRRRRTGLAHDGESIAHAEGYGPRKGRSEPTRFIGRPDASFGGDDAINWGDYGPAIRRWELTLGRPAPAPTITGQRGGQQLSPRFVEWMMGLPKGWVTEVPGLSRNDQLKLLGNGVVPQQAAAALKTLI